MMFAFILQLVVATNCFKLNTQSVYNAQRSMVQFQATPSSKLTGEEKKLCEEVIDGQTYELQVHLGKITFTTRGQVYDKNHAINLELSCQGNISNCSYAQVSHIQTATYDMIFHDIDLTLSSIVNLYQINIYDHQNCVQNAELIYDGISKRQVEIFIRDPAIRCPSNMISAPTTFKNKANVYLVIKIVKTPIITLSRNETNNYKSLFKFDNGSGSNNISKPSSLINFWQDMRSLGPYNDIQFIGGISILLSYIRQNPIVELAMRVQLLTEVKQVRDKTTNNATKSFYYNQSIEFSVGAFTNKNQADCFTSVSIELHKTFFYINTAQNTSATHCDRAYIKGLIKKPYDQIALQIIVSKNNDKSGFNYHLEHLLTDFQMGDDINRNFYCKDVEDCKTLESIAPMHRKHYNMSVSMKLLFMSNGTVAFSDQYNADLQLTNYNKTNVSILNKQICMEVRPYSIGSQQVKFALLGYQFDLSQYMNQHQTIYCSSLETKQLSQIKQIISKMKGNVDITPHISLSVGSKIVGDIEVIIYQTPTQNLVVLVVLYIFITISGLANIGITLGFRKNTNTWSQGILQLANSEK